MTDMSARLRVADINLRLMARDTEMALREVAERGGDTAYLMGLLSGIMAGKKVLDGCTADEAWELLTGLTKKHLSGGGDD